MNLDELAQKYGGSPVQSGSSKFDELAQKYGGSAVKVESTPERKSTIGSELVRGGKQLVSSIRTGAGALTGSPEEAAIAGVARGQAIGEEAGEGASLEAVKKAYQERGLLSAAGEVASQIPRALASQVPQLAAMAGSAKLGAMAGTAVAPGPGTVIGGVLGAGASLLPQFFGSNIERQAAEQMAKDQAVQIDRGAAGAAAAGQAAIESAGTAFVLGKRIVKGVLGVADDAALASAKAQQAMTSAAQRSLAAAAGRGVAKGAVVEIPVEIAQSVIERAQAGLDVTSPEALSEYGEVAYQAGLVGGAMGAGAGPVNTAMARQGVKARAAFEEAEAKRVADLEQARLDAEVPMTAEPLAARLPAAEPSPTQAIEDQAAELERQQQRQQAAMERARVGGIGGGSEVNQIMLEQARILREQQERAAAAEEKAAEAERQRALRAERVRIGSTQYSGDPMMNEVLRSRAMAEFEAANAPKVEVPPATVFEPTKTIEDTTPITQPEGFNVLRGVDVRNADLMSAVSERRAAEEAAAATQTKQTEAKKVEEAAKADTSRADVDQRVAQVENFLMSPVRKTQQETADYMAGVVPEMQKDFMALLDEDMSQPLTPEQTEALKAQIRQRLQPDFIPDEKVQRTPFKRFLASKGMNKKDVQDIFGENAYRANQQLPGAIRADGPRLDMLAEAAVEAGFLQNEDTEALVDMIKAEFGGDEQVSADMSGDRAAAEYEAQRESELESRAAVIGLKTKGMTPDQIAARLDRIERKREEKRRQYSRNVDGFADLPTADQDRIIDMMIDQFGEPQVFDVERAEIEGRVREEEELLQTQTEQQLRDKQAEIDRLEKENERLNKDAERKAKADEQVGDFVLTGSKRDADEAAARGQEPMFAEEAGKGYNISAEDQRIEKELTGKSMIQAADWAVTNAPNAFARVIAEKVRNRLREFQRKGMTLEFNIVGGSTRPMILSGARGITKPEWGKDDRGSKFTVTLNGAAVMNNQAGYPPGVQYNTILHELLHVATRSQFVFMPNTDPLKKQMAELFDLVVTRFNADAKAGTLPPVMVKYYKRMNNVLEDADELLTWGLTDKDVQAYFDDIKVGEKSVFTRLVELIRTALGLGKPYESALERLVRTSESMLDVDVDAIDAMLGQRDKQIGIKKKPAGPMTQESLFQKEGKPAAMREAAIPDFSEDIPNESWLQGKIEYAQSSPRNEFGVPKMSSVTGRFKEPVMVPARWLKDAKGQRGEEKNVRQKDLEAIRKIIRETGKFPLNEDGTEYVPYIEIGYDGKPWVSEGNHRIMAAIAEGMDYIPVELRYFDGGQRRAGVWSPGNVASITERVEQERSAAMRAPAKAPPTDSAAFKKWFGDSKVVDESGDPLVMYHGTDADITTFEPKDGMIFVTADPKFAEEYTTTTIDSLDKTGGQPNIIPVYVRAENPFDFGNPEHITALEKYEKDNRYTERSISNYVRDVKRGDYEAVESRKMQNAIKAMGHDGFYVREAGRQVKNLGVFRPEQIKSATGNIGTYSPDSADIRYQRDSITGKPILAQWTTPTDTKIAGDIGKDDIIYSLQNKMIDTKRVVDAISATAGKIAAKWNPYLQEELYHGRTAKQTKDFLTEELRPLMQAMEKAGVNIADMEEYLKNRHAIDYNAQVAKVNPKMPDKGSGIATADAQAYLNSMSPADRAKYEALAKRVDEITKGTRKLLVDSGLETQETINNWEKTFPFYVPLKRGDIDYAYTAGGMGTGQGFDVRGDFSRRAMGSEREATDVLANIAMMRERAIVKSQKNRVAQALFGLAAQNPNPQFWLPVDPMAEVDPANMQELLNFGLSQQDLDFIAKEPRQKAIDKKRNEVVERINATLRGNENVLSMRFNGQDRYVFFNPNDPRSQRMAKSMKNLDADQLGSILGPISTVTRWMAAVNTQYNPIFGAYNFLRDVQGAALQLSDTPLARERKAVVGGTLPALKGIYAAMRAERGGSQATGPWAALWQEFQQEGGQTGFRDQFSRSQERAEALQKELNKITEGKAKAAGRAIFDWLSDYNDSMENAVRLSAYKAALDKGINKQEAASIAKNLTVNFNRKGQIGVQAGALYAFFNAAVQGTTRLAQTLKGPAGKKIIAGGLLLGTMQAALLAAAGFDEEEPPEFIRERNLIIPIGGDKYVAFPMPLGYHVIPGTSRILTEWALSGFKDTPERIASLTGMFLEAFNPIGNAGWSAQTLAPTFADPIVALTENKDWTGKPIARKDFSNLDPTPGYTRSKEATSVVFKEIAKFLNFASGGTDFKPGVLSPTPDQLEYLVGQATGGIGRELSKAATTVEKTITGEELPSYKIPLVGRFYGETKSSAAESGRFYKNMEKLNKHENEIKGRRESKQPLGDYLKDNPEARLAPMARKVYQDVRELRKRREALIERDAPKESVQAVEKMITRKMQALNDRVRTLEESN